MNKTVLIVEDDMSIHNLEKELLTENGFKTLSAFSGTEALMQVKLNDLDLVLLDIMLPGMFGDEVVAKIKEIKEIPIIAITSKSDKESKISMFKKGVDDYIVKPFDIDELLLRINAVLRRSATTTSYVNILTYKDLSLNLDTYEVLVSNTPISLTKIEFKILKLLMSTPSTVFTKNNIYYDVWNEDFVGEDNSVNVHISNIRNKLTKVNKNESYIQTVWGIGFKMK